MLFAPAVAKGGVAGERKAGARDRVGRQIVGVKVGIELTRFREGLSSYYEVLEAQQQLFPPQLALAQTELNRRLVIVQLYKALGGGWNLKDAEWIAGQATAGAQGPAAGKNP